MEVENVVLALLLWIVILKSRGEPSFVAFRIIVDFRI